MWRIDRKHRKRAMENLRASFPEKPEKELEYIAERSMQHFIELVMDVLFTTRMVGSLSGIPLDPSGAAARPGAVGTARSAGTIRVTWATLHARPSPESP